MHHSQMVHGGGYIVGDVKWNSSRKALTEEEIKAKYWIESGERRGDTFSVSRIGKHILTESTTEKTNFFI